jgi:hypothetical protein
MWLSSIAALSPPPPSSSSIPKVRDEMAKRKKA